MHMTVAPFLSLLLLAPAIDGWLGIYLDNEAVQAVIGEVIPESPAARAGLRAGDVLLAVGDLATGTRESFIAAVRAAKPGESIAIRLRRDGQEQVIKVALGNRPEPAVAPASQAPRPSGPGRPTPAAESAPPAAVGRGFLGISVQETEGDGGVLIDRVLPDGPAAAAKLLAGERIVMVDGREVGNLADLEAALAGNGPGKQVVFKVTGETSTRSVTVRLGERPRDGGETGIAVAPMAPVQPTPPPAAVGRATAVEAELAQLRAELAELRKQLEELRRGLRRE